MERGGGLPSNGDVGGGEEAPEEGNGEGGGGMMATEAAADDGSVIEEASLAHERPVSTMSSRVVPVSRGCAGVNQTAEAQDVCNCALRHIPSFFWHAADTGCYGCTRGRRCYVLVCSTCIKRVCWSKPNSRSTGCLQLCP